MAVKHFFIFSELYHSSEFSTTCRSLTIVSKKEAAADVWLHDRTTGQASFGQPRMDPQPMEAFFSVKVSKVKPMFGLSCGRTMAC